MMQETWRIGGRIMKLLFMSIMYPSFGTISVTIGLSLQVLGWSFCVYNSNGDD